MAEQNEKAKLLQRARELCSKTPGDYKIEFPPHKAVMDRELYNNLAERANLLPEILEGFEQGCVLLQDGQVLMDKLCKRVEAQEAAKWRMICVLTKRRERIKELEAEISKLKVVKSETLG